MDNKLLIFILGLLNYIPTHYMAGTLSSWRLPDVLHKFMREGGPIATILVDVFIVNGPMLLVHVGCGYLMFKILIEKTKNNLYVFLAGYLVPFSIIYVGAGLEEKMFAMYLEWPHLFFTAFFPIGGLLIGYYIKVEKDLSKNNFYSRRIR